MSRPAWAQHPVEPAPDGVTRLERAAWLHAKRELERTGKVQQVFRISGKYEVLELGSAIPARAKLMGRLEA